VTLKLKGATEFGNNHYWILIALHTCFFVCLILEWILSQNSINRFWPVILIVIFMANMGRFWIIRLMKGRWSTKIIVPPQMSVAEKNRMLNLLHLKYFIVVIELIALPLLFNLYGTLLIFTGLNAIVLLKFRIPAENFAWRMS
jgi:methyltransferase